MDALARPPRRHGRDRPVVLAAPLGAGSDLSWPHATLHLHFACESRTTRRLALTLDSLVRVSRRVGRVADATTDPGRATASRLPTAGRARAPRTVLDARRDLPVDGTPPTPPKEGAHGLATSIRSRASTHARCNTPAEARATFARRFWPTPKRSWPARDANALGRHACYDRGGARASAQLPAARLRAQLKAYPSPDGLSRLPLDGFTYF